MNINELIAIQIVAIGKISVTVGDILQVFTIIFFTVLILWIVKKILFREKLRKRYNHGSLHSIYQIIRYLIWIITILLLLDTFNIKINALLAGSAALLVGVGLGLQETFNNFISGIILLFEGSIRVGDILEIDGEVVKVKRIGLRTSEALNRNDIVIIIPNSLFTNNKVINWNHQSNKTRFKIEVGVAYGSDVDLVIQLLNESALEHPKIIDRKSVSTRFINFGNSSLDFELLFYCNEIFRVGDIKSDIRKIINRKFNEHNISIPFPQMDIHFKSDETGIFKPRQ